jgi:hypothetical protein
MHLVRPAHAGLVLMGKWYAQYSFALGVQPLVGIS